MSSTPLISVVVPVFNQARFLPACIASLQAQRLDSGGFEIVVVDNGSDDGSFEIAADLGVDHALREPKRGAYAARNAGIRTASAPLIAFTDADCVADEQWLAVAAACMADETVGAAIGRCTYPPEATLPLRWLAAYENAKAAYVVAECPPSQHFAYTNNMVTRAEVLDEFGGFREWNRAADSEFVHRLARRAPAVRLAYRDDMRVTHCEFTTAGARLERLGTYTGTNARIPDFQELRPTQRFAVLARMLGQR